MKTSNFLQSQVQSKVKALKIYRRLELNQPENIYKNRKAFHKLRNNAGYGKTIKILRIRMNVRLVSGKKTVYTSKPSYMSQTIFDNDLVALSKSKVTLKLNKPAYDELCVLDLGKLLLCQFQLDYIKNKYYSKSRYR